MFEGSHNTDGKRIVRSSFDSGIVYDNDAFPARDATYASDNASTRHVVAIDVVGGELR